MAAAVTLLLAASVLLLAINCTAKYIKSEPTNINKQLNLKSDKFNLDYPLANRKHEIFIPLVAFQCGYRNKYMDKNGKWQNDLNTAHGCLKEKYDILKYCKNIYSTLDITNIVEYSHVSHINNWCKEDEVQCKHQAVVRPYRCIVGEFVSESLQVPSQCRFSHVASRFKCDDYKNWTIKAETECNSKIDEKTNQVMKLHSSSILDPCGISMFRGVEYVCCPKDLEIEIKKSNDINKDINEDDYNDDDEDEDDETVEDEEESEIFKQDPYFKEDLSNLLNEHDRFRDAEERLENKHRKKVTKLITEWNDLFERYNKMKLKDPKGAEEYKREMTFRFRKTVAALEKGKREQQTQIEELHDERVQSALNEKKRQATHDYRAALAKQDKTRNKNIVLKTLKNYIRAEEKDRMHMLNRYRHLLRFDLEAAITFEPILLHRLRYIDLRINGTLAMLHDFPHLEKQIYSTAVEFWNNYRLENTQMLGNNFLTKSNRLLGNSNEQNKRLIHLYKDLHERLHLKTATNVLQTNKKQNPIQLENLIIDYTTSATVTKKIFPKKTTSLTNITLNQLSNQANKNISNKMKNLSFLTKTTESILAEDLDEDQFDDDEEDEEEQIDVMEIEKKQNFDEKESKLKINTKFESVHNKTILPKILNQSKYYHNNNIKKSEINAEKIKNIKNNFKSSEENTNELTINIEPIISAPIRIHEDMEKNSPAYSRQNMLIAYNNEFRNIQDQSLSFMTVWTNRTTILTAMFALLFLIFSVFLLTRKRFHRHPGFIEIDVCTPEEQHVTGMQINGYENPTYSYFETPYKT